jgi:hypothetical protein
MNDDELYMKLQWAKANEFKEGDIVTVQDFFDAGVDYIVTDSKQLNSRTVELRLKRKDDDNEK